MIDRPTSHGYLLPPGYWLLGLVFLLAVIGVSTHSTAATDAPATERAERNLYLPVLNRQPEPLTVCRDPLPNLTYPAGDVMRPIADLDTVFGTNDLANAIFMRGHLWLVQSEDNQNFDGGINVFNIANPYRPVRVHVERDGLTYDLREAHVIGYSIRDGHHYVALLAAYGLMIWDWTVPTNPIRVSYLTLPSISPHPYNDGGFWVAWHGNTIYYSQGTVGLTIIDVSNIHAPRFHKTIGPPEFGGFYAGSVQTLGNYLYLGASGEGMAIFDISVPLEPVLISSITRVENQYSMTVVGDIAYLAAKHSILETYDISNPRAPVRIGTVNTQDKGGYVSYQDGYAFLGASSRIVKIDVHDPRNMRVVGTASAGAPSRDHDFATVMGNLIIIGDDHNEGAFIVPHQAQPDTTAPAVNRIVPADNATNQALTTAIGISFSDQIELSTVNKQTVIIRPLGGAALDGIYTYQMNLLNFQPAAPLRPNTTYEVVVPALGVRDLACNPTSQTVVSRFSTGSFVDELPSCAITPSDAALVGQPMTFAGMLRTGHANNTTWAWEFGDGVTAGNSQRPTYTYAAPGLYSVRATVSNPVGSSSCQIQQSVYVAPTATQPRTSATIVLDAARNKVWNVNPDNDSVSAIDLNSYAKLSETPVGGQPRTLALAPDGTVWVVNEDSATISILNGVTAHVIDTLALPRASRPYGIVFNPATGDALVTLQATGQVVRLDSVRRTIVTQVTVTPTARGLAMSGDGSAAFVSRFISPALNGELVEINPTTLATVRTIHLAYDPGPDTEFNGRGVPNAVGAPVIAPDGGVLKLPSKKDNTQRGAALDGLTHTFESTVRSIVSQVNLATRSEQLTARRDLNNRDTGTAVAFNPRGDLYFVTTQGTNGVDVFHRYTNQHLAAIDNVGLAPQGVVLAPDGQRLFIQSFLSRSVDVYDVTEIVNFGRNTAARIASVPVVAHETLSAQVLAGKRLFYNATDARINQDSYIACASCHLDERDDGRNWERSGFGEGLRNTISILGRGAAGQGRLHWSANFDEVQDFEHDLREQFGGRGMLSDEQLASGALRYALGDRKVGLSPELDALAAYLASLDEFPLSPHRTATGALTPAGERGRALFETAGCAQCHQGAQFSDGMIHNVGTLGSLSGRRSGMPLLGIETPTLRGLWESPPYLHDGSAATLAAVIDRHDNGYAFSAAESADLVSFLLQIDRDEPGVATLARPIVLAVSAREVASGSTLQLGATTADTLGPVMQVTFYADGVALHTDTSAPYTFAWTPTAAGYVLISAAARHASGFTSVANEEVMVRVLP